MPKQSAIAKGFARGLTADTVGAPADLANAFSNLLRAGVGFAGNKLGLLKPEQMPELIPNDQVPLTSDWFAKNTPLEDTGEDGYTAARIAGGFAGPAAKAANIGSVGKVANQSQRGALYRGDKSGIMAVHSVEADKLMAPPSASPWRSILDPDIPSKLRNELYQTSFGLTKGAPGTGFGSMLLIPNPHRVDPKTSPSVIRATDFYSPRYNDSYAGGGFDMGSRLSSSSNYTQAVNDIEQSERMLAHIRTSDPGLAPTFEKRIARALEAKRQAYEAAKANSQDVTARYNDRFGSAFSDGGIYAEGFGKGSRRDEPFDPQSFHQFRMDLSPKFQSLEHYAESLYGGKLLTADSDTPYRKLRDIEAAWDKTIYQLRPEGARETYGSSLMEREKIALLKKMAKGEFPSSLFNERTNKTLDANELQELQKFAQELIQKAKTNPSDYGEIKRFGAMGLNGDNFVGAINLSDPDLVPRGVLAGFANRKIPYFDMSGSRVGAPAEKILDMQDSIFHRKVHAPRQ